MDQVEAFRVAVFGVAGLVVGSFLTVVIHRLPRGESILLRRSACPGCGRTIRAVENVPVLSYLLLRGRCRGCRGPISAEYPLVEALTGGLFVGAALAFPSAWVAGMVATFLGVMVAAGAIDLHHRVIPNRLTYPALALFGMAIPVAAVTSGRLSLIGALLGLIAFSGGLLLLALVSPNGMGMGDVKLAALIGLVLGSLGLAYVAVAAAIAVLAGGLGAVVALTLGHGRNSTIPFGPCLAAGAAVAALLAPIAASSQAGP